MGKQGKKPSPKLVVSSAKSTRSKAPSATVFKKQKTASPFSRTLKVLSSSKVKSKKSPLKVSQKSKTIKKVLKKPAAVKKLNDNKTKKMVALQNKIALMNKKIKLAEKNAPALKKSVKKLVAKNPVKKSDKKGVDTPLRMSRRSGNFDKADSRDNLTKKNLKPIHSQPKSSARQPVKLTKKQPVNKIIPKSQQNSAKKVKPDQKSKTPAKKVATPTNKKEVKQDQRSATKQEVAKKLVNQQKKVSNRKRKLDPTDSEEEAPGQKVAYIHVGDGGERDLEEHLRGSSRVNIQILSTESLPDIDDSDMIHGLDHAGTSRDYVDDRHRCTVRCPVGCQGHLRPNEIVIYESVRYDGRLLGRRRMKGRFVEGEAGDEEVAALEMTDFRRIGGRGNRRRMNERIQRRRLVTQQRYRRTMEEDRNDSPIPPLPARLGVSSGLPQRVTILKESRPVEREVAEEHGWNTNDRSFNVVLKEGDCLTMRRHPVAQSTDCIRGKMGYSSGIHLWSLTWPVRQRGTHAVVGVATREAVLHSVGYQSLVGNTEHSWGWDLGRKKAYHNSRDNQGENYPPTITHHHQWTVPDTFHMVLDMDRGSLGFVVGDQFLGWSHNTVKPGERVFPIVSTVWGHCEVELKYLGGLERGVVGLQDLARGAIRTILGRDEKELERRVDTLSLPTQLKNYLKNQ